MKNRWNFSITCNFSLCNGNDVQIAVLVALSSNVTNACVDACMRGWTAGGWCRWGGVVGFAFGAKQINTTTLSNSLTIKLLGNFAENPNRHIKVLETEFNTV